MLPYAAGICEIAFDIENIETAKNAEIEVADMEDSMMPLEMCEMFGIEGVREMNMFLSAAVWF